MSFALKRERQPGLWLRWTPQGESWVARLCGLWRVTRSLWAYFLIWKMGRRVGLSSCSGRSSRMYVNPRALVHSRCFWCTGGV